MNLNVTLLLLLLLLLHVGVHTILQWRGFTRANQGIFIKGVKLGESGEWGTKQNVELQSKNEHSTVANLGQGWQGPELAPCFDTQSRNMQTNLKVQWRRKRGEGWGVDTPLRDSLPPPPRSSVWMRQW